MDPEEQNLMEENPLIREGGAEMYGPDDLNYLKTLIETSDVPPEGKKLLFGVFDRNVILTNMDRGDIYVWLNRVDAIIGRIVAYMPPEQYTTDIDLFLKNCRLTAQVIIKRPFHGFERRHQIARYHFVQRPEGEEQQEGGGGFFNKLFGGWR